jgi:ankyrin repeat protein
VNLNQVDGAGRSLLHLAILRPDPAACLFLLRHGAQVNLQTRDEARDSALHLIARAAASSDLTEVAEAILDGGRTTSTVGSSPSSSASSTFAADINLQNGAGETPLVMAVQHGNTAIFKLLLSHGANLELVTLSGKPALWFALQQEEGEAEQVYI